MAFSPELASQLASDLSAATHLAPSQDWLRRFLATQRPTTPISSLRATAKLRLLNSDLTSATASAGVIASATSASGGAVASTNAASGGTAGPAITAAATSTSTSTHPILPPDIADPKLSERRLRGPIVVQVLGVEDISRSRWEQVEAIEALQRGEGQRGREVVRLLPPSTDVGDGGGTGDGSGDARASASSRASASATRPTDDAENGSYKLLLQDAAGTLVWAIELKHVAGVRVGMSIGSKLLLRDVIVARAVLLLEPRSTSILGGKVEHLHEAWIKNRKDALKSALGRPDAGGS